MFKVSKSIRFRFKKQKIFSTHLTLNNHFTTHHNTEEITPPPSFVEDPHTTTHHTNWDKKIPHQKLTWRKFQRALRRRKQSKCEKWMCTGRGISARLGISSPLCLLHAAWNIFPYLV